MWDSISSSNAWKLEVGTWNLGVDATRVQSTSNFQSPTPNPRERAAGLASERSQAQLAEAGRERSGVSLPHISRLGRAQLIRRHGLLQHREELILRIRRCR